jgi:hypothetical protein
MRTLDACFCRRRYISCWGRLRRRLASSQHRAETGGRISIFCFCGHNYEYQKDPLLRTGVSIAFGATGMRRYDVILAPVDVQTGGALCERFP